MNLNVKAFALLLTLLSLCSIQGCSSSPYAGTWKGVVKAIAPKPTQGKGSSQNAGLSRFSETKASTESTLTLNGDGSYTAKMQEVDSGGKWKQAGTTLTLSPDSYMGMDKEHFPGGSAADGVFKAYELTASEDAKTLTHTDQNGVTTYTKAP